MMNQHQKSTKFHPSTTQIKIVGCELIVTKAIDLIQIGLSSIMSLIYIYIAITQLKKCFQRKDPLTNNSFRSL
jgi:hypothetical protein